MDMYSNHNNNQHIGYYQPHPHNYINMTAGGVDYIHLLSTETYMEYPTTYSGCYNNAGGWGVISRNHTNTHTQYGTNLFIHSLPKNMTDHDLYKMFRTIGPINSCRIIKDYETGHSFGYGFVDYETFSDAQRAIEHFNGIFVANNQLKVTYARFGPESTKDTKLFVSNLPLTITYEQLDMIFGKYGSIVQWNILRDKRGQAIIRYNKREEAQRAIAALNNFNIPGSSRPLLVVAANNNNTNNNNNNGDVNQQFSSVAAYLPWSNGGTSSVVYGNANIPNQLSTMTTTTDFATSAAYSDTTTGIGSSDRNASMTSAKNRLIVNYLPQDMGTNELSILFRTIGPIEKCHIIKDYKTDYSFGYGFVEYSLDNDAHRAIEILNGFHIRNKRLKVSYARVGGDSLKDTNIFVTYLPLSITYEQLDMLFGEYGLIIQRHILCDKQTGMPRGAAFVRYDKREEAQAAIAALNNFKPKGFLKPLALRIAEEHGKAKAAHFINQRAVERPMEEVLTTTAPTSQSLTELPVLSAPSLITPFQTMVHANGFILHTNYNFGNDSRRMFYHNGIHYTYG